MTDEAAGPAPCNFCGFKLAPTERTAYFCEDGDPVFCEEHFDEGGWHVRCSDRSACASRQKAAIAASRQRQGQADAERDAERQAAAQGQALIQSTVAGMAEVPSPVDYWRDDTRAGLDVLLEYHDYDHRIQLLRCPAGYLRVRDHGSMSNITLFTDDETAALYAKDADVVGIVEIAARLGVKRPTVDQWRQRANKPYTRKEWRNPRAEPFPEPFDAVGGRPAWHWGDVRAWAKRTGRIKAVSDEDLGKLLRAAVGIVRDELGRARDDETAPVQIRVTAHEDLGY